MALCHPIFRNILTAHAWIRLFRSFLSKIDPVIRPSDLHLLYRGNISSIGVYCHSDLAISLVRMRRNSVKFASGVKTVVAIVYSVHDFL